MKAIVFDEHGDIDVLRYRDIETPELEPGQVRIAVRACSLNYHDVFTRIGMPGIKVPLPGIPGCDAAGQVSELGPGVDGWSVGDRVLVDPVFWDLDNGKMWMIGDTWWGAYAEYVVFNASQLIALDDDISYEDASCLPVAYGTAHRMMFTRGRVTGDDTVLVLGASGGVGSCAVLLAKQVGARVIAAAGSDEKCEQLVALGADETINMAQMPDGLDKFTADKGSFDVMYECTGAVPALTAGIHAMRPGGTIMQLGLSGDMSLPMMAITAKELSLKGSFRFHDEFKTGVSLMQKGLIDVKPLITHTVGIDNAEDGFKLASDRSQAMKTQIQFT